MTPVVTRACRAPCIGKSWQLTGVVHGGAPSAGYFQATLPLLNQLSLFIVWSVLLDTFVVRPLLVPATMGILLEWNWWPMGKRFPAPTKQLPEFGGELLPVAADGDAAVKAGNGEGERQQQHHLPGNGAGGEDGRGASA